MRTLTPTLIDLFENIECFTTTYYNADNGGIRTDLYHKASRSAMISMIKENWHHSGICTALIFFPMDLVVQVVMEDAKNRDEVALQCFLSEVHHALAALRVYHNDSGISKDMGNIRQPFQVPWFVDVEDQAKAFTNIWYIKEAGVTSFVSTDEARTPLTISYQNHTSNQIVKTQATHEYTLSAALGPQARESVNNVLKIGHMADEMRLVMKLKQEKVSQPKKRKAPSSSYSYSSSSSSSSSSS